MSHSVGTVLKKAKPLNKLRPDKCGSPFAVRVLAFLTTSLSAWRSVVSFLQSEEKCHPQIHSGNLIDSEGCLSAEGCGRSPSPVG